MKKKLRVETLVFILPALLIIFFFMFLPMVESFTASFHSNTDASKFVGLKNYIELFKDPVFINFESIKVGKQPYGALINSIIWIVIHLPLSMFLGLMCALIMIRLPRVHFLRSMIFLGMVIPGVITGVVTQFLFEKSSGMVSNFFGMIGVVSLYKSWFAYADTALLALILTSVWVWTGYSMIVFLSALSAIPDSFIEAAVLDGANIFQVFWFIKLPLLKNSISTVVVMSIINELTSFDIVYSSTYGGPGGASNVLGLQMYLESFRYSNFGTGAAIATVMTLIATIPIYFNVRNTVKK
ncbi:MAG: sugar ABC transporter permease [Sphaerochaeta sp.]|nr:sugar ABC transporter permease [Sphaerochaeta sp.]